MRCVDEERLSNTAEFIGAYFISHGRAPTYRRIMAECGYASIGTVAADVARLKERGAIPEGGSGAWEPIGIPQNLAVGGFHAAPLVGSVRCGSPNLAVEDVRAAVALPDEIFGRREHVLLTAEGCSMIGRGIYGGDYLVVHRQPVAAPGDTVIAILEDGSSTCKILAEEKGRRYLRAANDETDREGRRVYDVYPEGEWSVYGVVDMVIHTPGREF